MAKATSVWNQEASPQTRAGSVETEAEDAPPILVSDAPPTSAQRGAAWGIVGLLCAAFAVALPFYSVDLPVVSAFVPVVHAVVLIAGLIAAAFLFSQYAVQPQPAFLALAGGYLMAGLFSFFQSLAFPDAYSPAGLLGGDPSAAAWLFLLWRTSFPLGILVYALTRHASPAALAKRSVALPIALTIGCVLIVACVLTWFVAIVVLHLPTLFTDATHEAAGAHYTTIPAIVLSLAAIVLLTRRRTTLDLWLVVALIAALPDIVVPVTRYALGFYLARSYELISSCAVLIALLTESSILYARLASAKALQVHGEAERLSSIDTVTSAISHELRQPLTAISLHAQAGTRLLSGLDPLPPDLSEILSDISDDARRASDVIDRIRQIFRHQKPTMVDLDINAVVADAIRLVSDDVKARQVTVITDLATEHLHVGGDRTQIIQVLLNLIANGMDAMKAVPPSKRRLTLVVEKRDENVVTSVSDCGSGISPENIPHIFDPFFTTRRGGMGLGLSISQSIVLAHNGRLWAENAGEEGAIFHFSLPIWSPDAVSLSAVQ